MLFYCIGKYHVQVVDISALGLSGAIKQAVPATPVYASCFEDDLSPPIEYLHTELHHRMRQLCSREEIVIQPVAIGVKELGMSI